MLFGTVQVYIYVWCVGLILYNFREISLHLLYIAFFFWFVVQTISRLILLILPTKRATIIRHKTFNLKIMPNYRIYVRIDKWNSNKMRARFVFFSLLLYHWSVNTKIIRFSSNNIFFSHCFVCEQERKWKSIFFFLGDKLRNHLLLFNGDFTTITTIWIRNIFVRPLTFAPNWALKIHIKIALKSHSSKTADKQPWFTTKSLMQSYYRCNNDLIFRKQKSENIMNSTKRFTVKNVSLKTRMYREMTNWLIIMTKESTLSSR